MKAVGYYASEKGAPELIDIDVPVPDPGPRDLLVRVNAVSVNPVDHKVRQSVVPPAGEAKILGFDAAGIVESVGADVELFKPGDEVFYAGDITRPGTNSEFHAVDERIVGRKPQTLDFAESAALPLTAITAWEALFDRLAISRTGKDQGNSILIIGAAGGVGSIAVQLAKRKAKLNVIGTASRAESIEWARQHGADIVLNHRKPLDEELVAAGISSVDYILCANTTDGHWQAMANAIAPQGRICAIVDTESVDLNLLKKKSVTFSWEFMFTRPMYGTKDLLAQQEMLNEISELIDNQTLVTTLARVVSPINATNLRKVHEEIIAGHTIGKTVLSDWDDGLPS